MSDHVAINAVEALPCTLTAGAVAWGAFVDSGKTVSNFGKLRIVTDSQSRDDLQMRAAGFLEGYLTAGVKESVLTGISYQCRNSNDYFSHRRAHLRPVHKH